MQYLLLRTAPPNALPIPTPSVFPTHPPPTGKLNPTIMLAYC